MGPHPAVAEVRLAVRRQLVELRPEMVLVACSGGADSLALAAAVAFEAPRLGVRAGLVTIDHGLQDGSAERAEQVAQLGRGLGLDPVQVIKVEVGTAGGPEAAARTARYAAFESCGGLTCPEGVNPPQVAGSWVALGHTLDDQAETVLLGLGRGSGPSSIAGMRPVSGRYLRPLLGVRRAITRAACEALGLPVWDDPHNDDRSYRRVRIRHEALPLFEDVLGGGVAAALARTAELMRDDQEALDALAVEALSRALSQPQSAVINSHSPGLQTWSARVDHEYGGEFPAAGLARLAAQPKAIRTRVLKLWAEGGGSGQLSAVHVHQLDELVMNWHGQGAVQLPGGFEAKRSSGRLGLRSTKPAAPEPAAPEPASRSRTRE